MLGEDLMSELQMRAAGLFRRARHLAALGRDRRAKLFIFTVVMTMPIKSRVAAFAAHVLHLRLRHEGADIDICLADLSELLAMEQILLIGEYEAARPQARKAHTILDLGANVGLASLWFAHVNPRARIIAVEPDPVTFARLARNVDGYPNITIVNKAIADRSGTVRFEHSRHSWASKVSDGTASATIEVPSVSLDELVESLHIHEIGLIKMDIEGMEWSVLNTARCLDRTAEVIGEIHPQGEADADEFLEEAAAAHGLTRSPALNGQLFLLSRTAPAGSSSLDDAIDERR